MNGEFIASKLSFEIEFKIVLPDNEKPFEWKYLRAK